MGSQRGWLNNWQVVECTRTVDSLTAPLAPLLACWISVPDLRWSPSTTSPRKSASRTRVVQHLPVRCSVFSSIEEDARNGTPCGKTKRMILLPPVTTCRPRQVRAISALSPGSRTQSFVREAIIPLPGEHHRQTSVRRAHSECS